MTSLEPASAFETDCLQLVPSECKVKEEGEEEEEREKEGHEKLSSSC